MAKGYPSRRSSDVEFDYPILDDVIKEGTCMICKRRPATTKSGECATCYAALHPAHA